MSSSLLCWDLFSLYSCPPLCLFDFFFYTLSVLCSSGKLFLHGCKFFMFYLHAYTATLLYVFIEMIKGKVSLCSRTVILRQRAVTHCSLTALYLFLGLSESILPHFPFKDTVFIMALNAQRPSFVIDWVHSDLASQRGLSLGPVRPCSVHFTRLLLNPVRGIGFGRSGISLGFMI